MHNMLKQWMSKCIVMALSVLLYGVDYGFVCCYGFVGSIHCVEYGFVS